MKGMYLGRRFYRQMFGLVLLIPVVMYTASLYPVMTLVVFQVALGALFVGMVLYLAWRGWIDPGGSSHELRSSGFSDPIIGRSFCLSADVPPIDPVERISREALAPDARLGGI